MYNKFIKRLIDIVLSGIGIVVLSPVYLIVALAIKIDDPGPVFFRQKRVGIHKTHFNILKFRTMKMETPKDTPTHLLENPQQYITRVGRILRKTSLDELLNFVSIFNGDMSLIGPRPLLDYYGERLHNRHKSIFLVKPGLECPTLHKVDHALSWQERLDNYVWYVENCSFWVDVRLALRIVAIALDRKSTAVRSTATHGGLLGYDTDGNVIYTKQLPDKYAEEFCRNHGYTDMAEALEARKQKQ